MESFEKHQKLMAYDAMRESNNHWGRLVFPYNPKKTASSWWKTRQIILHVGFFSKRGVFFFLTEKVPHTRGWTNFQHSENVIQSIVKSIENYIYPVFFKKTVQLFQQRFRLSTKKCHLSFFFKKQSPNRSVESSPIFTGKAVGVFWCSGKTKESTGWSDDDPNGFFGRKIGPKKLTVDSEGFGG